MEPLLGTANLAFHYRLFGMPFAISAPMPWIAETGEEVGAVQVRFGTVPSNVDNPVYCDTAVQASATEYLFAYDHQSRLYIRGDSEIMLEQSAEAELSKRWMLIFGVGVAVGGFQHDFVPLHASAVGACGICVALAGQSGFGKSTLAASLVRMGYPLFADDLCLIQPRLKETPLIGADLSSRACATMPSRLSIGRFRHRLDRFALLTSAPITSLRTHHCCSP